jgi:simple sugar transport system ATP-binding protein
VLRHGKLVAEAVNDTAGELTQPQVGQAPVTQPPLSQQQLAQWMVGHAVEPAPRRPAASVGETVCELTDACTAKGGRERLDMVSLTLRAGEIVAIAGVSGNGQVALAEVLCGTRRLVGGQARYLGQPLAANPATLVRRGLARIPEDRHGVGVVGDLPVWENAVAERLRGADFSRAGFIRRRAAWQHAARIETAFDVRGGGLATPARSLSGGNMQKLILGRALMAPDGRPPRLIVAHQPTWGLDIGAVAYVQQQLIAARDAGAAVLLISDDLDEVLALGDRVAVMHAGRLGPPRPAEAWTREHIGLAMAGIAPNEKAKA